MFQYKFEVLTRCWFNVGQASQTLGDGNSTLGERVCWDIIAAIITIYSELNKFGKLMLQTVENE